MCRHAKARVFVSGDACARTGLAVCVCVYRRGMNASCGLVEFVVLLIFFNLKLM